MQRRYELVGTPLDHGASEAESGVAPQILREKMLSERLPLACGVWPKGAKDRCPSHTRQHDGFNQPEPSATKERPQLIHIHCDMFFVS
jgi:hypothetical protein